MYRYSVFKSVQYGSVTLNSGVTSNTATITSVTTANAVVCWLAYNNTLNNGNGTVASNLASVVLTNATTVTAQRNTSDTNNTTLYFVVFEFLPGIVKSNQAFTVTVTAASGTATISSVNTAKTVIFPGGVTSNDSSGAASQSSRNLGLSLTNATTVTATGVNIGTTQVAYGTALEFK